MTSTQSMKEMAKKWAAKKKEMPNTIILFRAYDGYGSPFGYESFGKDARDIKDMLQDEKLPCAFRQEGGYHVWFSDSVLNAVCAAFNDGGFQVACVSF